MKVGIDLRPLSSGGRSGVEEYLLLLLDSLDRDISDEDEVVLFVSGSKDPDLPFSVEQKYPRMRLVWKRVPNKLLNASFTFFGYPLIDQLMGGVDVVVFPNINFSAIHGSTPYIVIAHDLSFMHFPSFLSLKRKIWHIAVRPEKLFTNAEKILSVSHSTKDDLVSSCSVDSDCVEVMRPFMSDFGAEDFLSDRVRDKYQLPKKYILSFGTLEPRKNMNGLLSAFGDLMADSRFDEYSLVFAGKAGWKVGNFAEEFDFFDPKRILFTGFVDEEDKKQLYAGADLFVYPTFFEGFGFPLVEAALARTPIVTCAHSSVFEIIGNGALLVDPVNVADLSYAMKIMLESDDVACMYVERARQRVDQLFEKNISIYDHIATIA